MNLKKERIVKNILVDSERKCWIWQRSRDRKGYGRIWNGSAKMLAHRYSYLCFTGEIPIGLCVLHICDTPACVNPSHLRLGTIAENNRDMREKGRDSRGSSSPRSKITESQVLEMFQRRSDGAKLTELATEFGICLASVSAILNKKKWTHVIHVPTVTTGKVRGSQNPRARLTEADIPDIRQQVQSGTSMRQVAFRFNVRPPTIESIIKGRTWKHVK